MPKRPQKKSNQPQPAVPADHPDARPDPGDIGLQAIATIDKHKKTVIICALAAAIALCVGIVGKQIREQKRIAAAEAYSLAASERSIEKLRAVVTDHSGSAAAGNALLTQSEIHLSMEKPEDAKIALLTFVDQFKKHPRYVQGLFALGNLHHNSGDGARAADYYRQALEAGPDSDVAPLIVIRQGDLALEAADQLQKEGKAKEAGAKKDEADILYQDSVRKIEYRANRFIPIAEEKIELLKLGDVPVVPAPPPPPEPEKPDPAKPKPKPGTGTVLQPEPTGATPKTDPASKPPAPGDDPAATAEKPTPPSPASPKGKGKGKGKSDGPPKETDKPSPPAPDAAEKPAPPTPKPDPAPNPPTPAPDPKPKADPPAETESRPSASDPPASSPGPKPPGSGSEEN